MSRGWTSGRTHAWSRGWIIVALLGALGGCAKSGAPASGDRPAGAPPDLAGVWLPIPERAEAWPASLPLTTEAQSAMASFNPAEHDPTRYCMPFGTPRNMLQTEYPMEIVQTAQRVVIVLQPNLANAEVRRIPIDGSALPESPDPSWYGTSRGRWEGGTLIVETVGMRPDALVSGNGLRHSEQLRVVERLSIKDDPEHGRMLVDDIELHDSKAYQQPLKTRRYFAWSPQTQLQEANGCIEIEWIDKTWRQRLEEHAAEQKTRKSR